MPVNKDSAPGNAKAAPKAAPQPDLDPALVSNTTSTSGQPVDAAGDVNVVSSPEGVGLSAQEMQQVADAGYHDSMSGRPVDASGNFMDGVAGDGPIPPERIVANDWPQRQASGSRAMTPEEATGESPSGNR